MEVNHKTNEDISKHLKQLLASSAENYNTHLNNLNAIKKMCQESSEKHTKEVETAINEEMEKATNQWHQIMENFEDLTERLDVQVNKCSKLSEKLLNQVSF